MEPDTRIIELELSDGTLVKVEATPIGEQQVSINTRPFREATAAIEAIANEISETLERVKPTKASVKFGIEIGVESGQLTALLVKGTSKANLEITLEWTKVASQTPTSN